MKNRGKSTLKEILKDIADFFRTNHGWPERGYIHVVINQKKDDFGWISVEVLIGVRASLEEHNKINCYLSRLTGKFLYTKFDFAIFFGITTDLKIKINFDIQENPPQITEKFNVHIVPGQLYDLVRLSLD